MHSRDSNSASFSGGSEHWARDAREPLSHRVSVTWVLLVGNASEERFPSELTGWAFCFG